MDDLGELYQEVILEHSKAPRNYRRPESANRHAEGYNPLCGDRCTVFIDYEGDAIKRDRVPGVGMRDLQGIGIDDDADAEGQDQRRGSEALRGIS